MTGGSKHAELLLTGIDLSMREVREMKTYMRGVSRQGTCLCGQPVAAHFDDRNAKHDCETVRMLAEDERAAMKEKR